MSAVFNLKISKSTIDFKIGIIQFIHDYSKLQNSSISLHFLKNNFRVKRGLQRVFIRFSVIFFEISSCNCLGFLLKTKV